MADFQVQFATKSSVHRDRITHVGGLTWTFTADEAISAIDRRYHSFYTLQGGERAEVGVVRSVNGPYLRTYANGKWTDNLLSLPPCKSGV